MMKEEKTIQSWKERILELGSRKHNKIAVDVHRNVKLTPQNKREWDLEGGQE